MFVWHDDEICPRGAEFANYMILRCKNLETELEALRRQPKVDVVTPLMMDRDTVIVAQPCGNPMYIFILVVVVAIMIGFKVNDLLC